MEDYFASSDGRDNLKAEIDSRFDRLSYILSKAFVRCAQQDDVIIQETPCLANLIDVAFWLNVGALVVIKVPREKASPMVFSRQRLLSLRTRVIFVDCLGNSIRRRRLVI